MSLLSDQLRGLRVTKTMPNGSVMVLCPFHDDKHGSMHVGPGDGFYCYACGAQGGTDVLAQYQLAADKSVIDLYNSRTPEPESHSCVGVKGAPPQTQTAIITNRYIYTDEFGSFAHRTIRYEPKSFSQQRAAYDSEQRFLGWSNQLRNMKTYLYNLPAILKSKLGSVVVLVEGEKDADRLIANGFLATTTPMGAGKWRDYYTNWLEGKRVVIIPDDDQIGRDYAHEVAQILTNRGIEVGVIGGLGVKDISVWFDNGGTAGKLQDMIDLVLPRSVAEQLRELTERVINSLDLPRK
jgi:hypothetical protein